MWKYVAVWARALCWRVILLESRESLVETAARAECEGVKCRNVQEWQRDKVVHEDFLGDAARAHKSSIHPAVERVPEQRRNAVVGCDEEGALKVSRSFSRRDAASLIRALGNQIAAATKTEASDAGREHGVLAHEAINGFASAHLLLNSQWLIADTDSAATSHMAYKRLAASEILATYDEIFIKVKSRDSSFF